MPFGWFKRTPQPNSPREKRRKHIYGRCRGRDCYTGERLDRDRFHIDHGEPRIRAGQSTLDNLYPTKPETNLRKGGKTVEEFRQAEHLRKRAKDRKFPKRRIETHQFYYEKRKWLPWS
jgi:hypothetical protein